MSIWKNYEHFIFNRIVEGLISALLANKSYPVIKYVKDSEICSLIGQRILDFYNNNSDFIIRNCGREPNSLLVLFDRREDPVTPLLNQFTYQVLNILNIGDDP